jgi:hypothetical protein
MLCRFIRHIGQEAGGHEGATSGELAAGNLVRGNESLRSSNGSHNSARCIGPQLGPFEAALNKASASLFFG